MRFLLLFVLAAIQSTRALEQALKQEEQVWHRALKQSTSIDFEAVRPDLHLPTSTSSEFVHSEQLFQALEAGSNTFVATEAVTEEDAKKWDLSSYEKIKDKALYTSTATFTLKPQQKIISLDSTSTQLKELGLSSITHCSRELHSSVSARDLIIGSNKGSWWSTVEEARQNGPSHGLFPERTDGAHTMVLARRVLRVESLANNDNCHVIKTESIHFLELFEHMKIESKGVRPFHEWTPASPASQSDIDINVNVEQSRELGISLPAVDVNKGANVVYPDAPIVTCDKFSSPSGMGIPLTSSGKNSAYGISYSLATKGGCVQYNYNLGSISMNYAWNTHSAAVSNVKITDGLICSNCYVYTGAGFMAIAEYSTNNFFNFEVKVGGGAGLSINLAANNPTVKANLPPITVAGAGAWSSFPIGSGLSMSIQSRGMVINLSGSGTLVGSGQTSGGAEAYASVGVMIANQVQSLPTTAFDSYRPVQNSMSFSTMSPAFAATVLITGSFGVKLAFGPSLGTAAGHADVTVTANLDYKMSSSTTLTTARIDTHTDANTDANAKASAETDNHQSRTLLRKKSSSSLSQAVFAPGAEIKMRSDYSGYTPNEEHVAYYSIVGPLGEHRVDHHSFTTTKSGKGSFVHAWTVPFDENFLLVGSPVRLAVRTSNLLTRAARTSEFVFDLSGFSRDSTAPMATTTLVAAGEPFKVTWDPNLLHTYELPSMSPLKGQARRSAHVSFELLCADTDTDTGASASSNPDNSFSGQLARSWRQFSPRVVGNSGSAHLTIPREAADDMATRCGGSGRFRVKVHDDKADNVAAPVNAGAVFSFRHQNQLRATAGVAVVNLVNRLAIAARRIKQGLGLGQPQSQLKQSQSPQDSERALLSCPSGLQITVSGTVKGQVDSMKLLTYNAPIPASQVTSTVLPPSSVCGTLSQEQ